MRVISLNIWGGYLRAPLLEFVERHSDVDLFCLQEVYCRAPRSISTDERAVVLDIFSELQERLPHHRGYFRPVVDGAYGLCIFAREVVSIENEGEELIHHNPDYLGLGPTHSRILQWVRVNETTPFAVVNVHGLWNGCGKGDSPERLAQSRRIKAFVDGLQMPVILLGDFNLGLETESLRLLESGLSNLIRLFGVASTRTSHYTKPERMADYVFVSPNVEVTAFEVLGDEVSDHAPLALDFSVSCQTSWERKVSAGTTMGLV